MFTDKAATHQQQNAVKKLGGVLYWSKSNWVTSQKPTPDVTPKSIELYDLQGRIVRTQRNGLESLNLQGLSAGQYVMKVTLEDGNVFSDKVVKE